MIRPISIEAVLGGFIVRVGCQTVVFRHRQEMLAHLDAYLQHPEEVERDFLANAENARQFQPGDAPGGIAGVSMRDAEQRRQAMPDRTLDDLVNSKPATSSPVPGTYPTPNRIR